MWRRHHRISVLENGRVFYTGDEPTGGFHLDLVIAGNYKISTEEAEENATHGRAMMFGSAAGF